MLQATVAGRHWRRMDGYFDRFCPMEGPQDERGSTTDFECCFPGHRAHPAGPDLCPPFFDRRRFPLRRGAMGAADRLDYRHEGQHDLRAEGRGGAGGLVDDGHQYRGLEVSARADGHAGARDAACAQLVGRVVETIRDWGMASGYFATRCGCGHLPRRAGAHAADAEGGVQLAGVVQRGLRPAGAGVPTGKTGTGTR